MKYWTAFPPHVFIINANIFVRIPLSFDKNQLKAQLAYLLKHKCYTEPTDLYYSTALSLVIQLVEALHYKPIGGGFVS